MAGGLLLLGPGAGVAHAQAASAPQTAAGPEGSASSPPPSYKVGPGDMLQIVVWKEPELTRDVLVRVDGWITLPLLGDIEAVGRTPREITQEITRGLSRFLTAPQVTVGLGQATRARVYVIGQVVRSGEIPLSFPLTVVQALALSGGFKEYAKAEGILIVGKDHEVASFNYKKFEAGKDLAQNVTLKPGDTIVVP